MISFQELMASLRIYIGMTNCHRTCRFQCSVLVLSIDRRNRISNINMIFQDTRVCSWVWFPTSMQSGYWTPRFQIFQFVELAKSSNAHTLSRQQSMSVTQSSAWMTMRSTVFRTLQIRKILSTFGNTYKPISACLSTKTSACSRKLSASSGDGVDSFATAVISALGRSRA